MEKVMRCTECGRMWDMDGCRIALTNASVMEVEDFLCESCKADEGASGQ